MAFDPNKPQASTPVDAVEMRAQLNGLKDLIDTQAAQLATQAATIATLQATVTSLQTQIDNRATLADLTNAIAGTANSTNSVSDLSGLTISDPPTQGEVVTILDKLNETVNTSHR